MECTPRRPGRGFTLVELLIVIAIISLLVTIIMPSLAKAKELARQATCLSHTRSQLQAIHLFASERDQRIPAGPDFPMMIPGGPPGPPMNTVASNLVWVGSAQMTNAHGVLITDGYIIAEAMFCPDDDSADPIEELAKIKQRVPTEAYCSYLYRQYDGQGGGVQTRLDNLGDNSNGAPVTALLMDMNSRLPIAPTRTNHRGLRVSVGFAAGNVRMIDTPNEELSLRWGDVVDIFGRLDEILEYADRLGR